MRFGDEGQVRLDTRKYKVVLMIEIDVVADLNITPDEIITEIREGLMLKKRYESLHVNDISMEYEVHVEDDYVDLIEV